MKHTREELQAKVKHALVQIRREKVWPYGPGGFRARITDQGEWEQGKGAFFRLELNGDEVKLIALYLREHNSHILPRCWWEVETMYKCNLNVPSSIIIDNITSILITKQ